MAKFTLVAAPTFKHTIMIPTAGADDSELQFTFKHRTLSELREMETAARAKQEACREEGDAEGELKSMAEFIMEIASGWEIKDKFTEANLVKAFVGYPKFFDAVVTGYTRELYCLREKR